MKQLVCVVIASCVVATAAAQFKGNEFGGSIFYGHSKLTKDQETLVVDAAFYGVSWYPRFIITEMGASSISIGIPLTAGLSGNYNSRTGGELSFGIDAPLMVDYNVGFGALSEEEESRFGGFVGAGFGYTSTASTTIDDVNTSYWDESYFTKAKSYGPAVHAGMRIPLGQDGLGITLRLSYKKGLEEQKFNFFGVSAFFKF
jgi:hypothetical protein